MPNGDIQNELLSVTQRGAADNVDRLKNQMELLTNVAAQQLASIRDNTNALVQNTLSGSSNKAADTARTVGQSLGIGMFLSPIITGIAKLFGGGRKDEPPPLVQYTQPPSISFEGGMNSTLGLAGSATYDQNGAPRVVQPVSNQNVTIQIQALDSRSILDRSDDIARAVREAMLNSHSINGTISEL